MSEPKLISPLLDNFVMGDPISEHNGVRCCPAINKNTDEKYIVKIISVPASALQLDALLLSGAYDNKDAAVSYYKSIADSISAEAEVLQKLAQLEGFLSIEAWQLEPMEDGSGYDVYLLSAYRNTLRHQLRRNNMTHLQALNLGLDLCAALATARRYGYLYVDLKPANIYISGTQEYRIGDIGFINLSSLQYQSLPDRYRSTYTAPEITDAYSSLNATIDIYAVGLILYQAFNGGQLPFPENEIPTEGFAPPAYADYEMAEIILKACAIDPDQRWHDPVEMGQALVNYMQRNGAHDTPIIPATDLASEDMESDTAEGRFEEQTSTTETEPSDNLEDVAIESTSPSQDATPVSNDIEEDLTENITVDSIYTEDDNGNLTFIEDPVDETTEEQDGAEIEYDEVTDEVSDMLLQADELIAHEAPEPVVAPEPIEVPVPPVIALEPEETQDEPSEEETTTEDTVAEQKEEETQESPNDVEEENSVDDELPEEKEIENADEELQPIKKKKSNWILWLFALLAAAALLIAGFYGYKNYYVQTIDQLTLIAGENGTLTVNITTSTDEKALCVVCTDTYGIQKTESVTNGKATFTDLMPNSAYTIKVVITGFHKLIGETTASYATPAQTEILQFTAITGAEDGSVILSFTHSGPEPEQWCITYTDHNGIVEKNVFTGRMLTIPGLQIGTEYTFTLETATDMSITGANTVTHIAQKIIKPNNLLVTGCIDGKLTATWSVEEGTEVDSWTVRCYNDTFDQTLVVDTCSVSVDVPDVTANYILEVKAAGMSINDRAEIAKNSLTVKDFTIDNSNKDILKLSWAPAEEAPADGWILRYSVDNSSATQITIADSNSAVIENIVPGAEYIFELLTADNTAVLGGKKYYTTNDAETFAGYDVTAAHMVFKMCKTPENRNWDRYDLSDSDYTTTFKVGEKASFLIKLTHAYDTSSDNISTMFVIRDENGSIVDILTSSSTWRKMWYKNYCELDIPQLPQVAGEYSVTVYFNGAFANTTSFTVTE